jgi:hypothetical protein
LRTFPLREISPVIPSPMRTGSLSAKLTNEEVIVIPADGPSLGVAPSGK